MPNRIIKDTIAGSEKINGLTDFQFRLWVHLITYVDDFGRGDARPAMIKGSCFPLRDRISLKDIDDALHAMAGAGCVSLYSVDGRPYLCFPSWARHQRIQTKRSKCPPPPESTVTHGESRLESNPIQSNMNPNPNPNPNSPSDEGESARAREDGPPTLQDVVCYAKSRGLKVDPQRFYDYYAARKWTLKGTRIEDWRAAYRSWETNGYGNPQQAGNERPASYDLEKAQRKMDTTVPEIKKRRKE